MHDLSNVLILKSLEKKKNIGSKKTLIFVAFSNTQILLEKQEFFMEKQNNLLNFFLENVVRFVQNSA
uniref:Uncharacterized protein n=1 Tax=Romanomermis culicivorax TaxID=13658 RepID=A0A915HL11_ROMCU